MVTLDPNIPQQMKFKTRQALLSHFRKHGPTVGASTPEEYLAMANALRQRGLVRLAKKGKVRMYDPRSGHHIIIDPDMNKLLTFYLRKAMLS